LELLTVRLYLDTSPVIYLVERTPFQVDLVMERISDPNVLPIISDLTRLECRVKPLRERNLDLLQDFSDFFEAAVAEIIPISREVIDTATEIRAEYEFRVPDAIHLAAAVVSRCDEFLTNDRQLSRYSGIAVTILNP
jgi:predicted nucleic acid-binding protein